MTNATRDIVDLLAEIENSKPGGPMPPCLNSTVNSWGTELSTIAGRARAEILELDHLAEALLEILRASSMA